jgi:hypothetical protein
MAQIYGMEQEEYDELPKGVQLSVKMAHEQATELTALREKVTTLEAAAPALVVKEPVNDNPGPHNNWKLTPFEVMSFETRRDQLLDQVERGTDKKLAVAVSKYRTEILALIKENHPQYGANAAFISNAIGVVVGKHLTEILAEVKAGSNDWFSETSGGSSSTTDPNAPKDYAKLLTEEQRKAAGNFGLSHEAYYNSLQELGVS